MEIKIQKVSFKYQRSYPVSIDDISIKFQNGAITSIIGNNGCGKSTLLNLISGVVRPSKGKIFINDLVFTRRSSFEEQNKIMSEVGYLPQILNDKVSSKTVLDELNSNDMEKIKEIFNLLNISFDILDEEYSFLNNVMKRKVALSKILIYNPNIILLDEPIIGFDNNTKKALINYLIKLKKIENKIVIIASNDIDFINRVSDDIIVLENGKVIKSEKKGEIFRDVNFFYTHNISIPKIIELENLVLQEKGIRLGYRDEINDLIKDILRKC